MVFASLRGMLANAVAIRTKGANFQRSIQTRPNASWQESSAPLTPRLVGVYGMAQPDNAMLIASEGQFFVTLRLGFALVTILTEKRIRLAHSRRFFPQLPCRFRADE
jgi:hypothetical protein